MVYRQQSKIRNQLLRVFFLLSCSGAFTLSLVGVSLSTKLPCSGQSFQPQKLPSQCHNMTRVSPFPLASIKLAESLSTNHLTKNRSK